MGRGRYYDPYPEGAGRVILLKTFSYFDEAKIGGLKVGEWGSIIKNRFTASNGKTIGLINYLIVISIIARNMN